MLSVFALIFCAAAVLPAQANDHLVVKTDKGKVRGKLSADGQVREFLGIPYAAPPVGDLRWRPPQAAKKWHEVFDATNFGHRCIQTETYRDMVFRDPGQSEDCLNLNVWAPAKHKGKLPVMVWIYGGGFTGGATSEPRQDGVHLAHKGVIVVSMNYRLGIFGFLATPELAAESPHHAAGNYGLMDQTAALQWVKKNIKRFGGDPKRVTIFGESAGSLSVAAQMASPLAQGLFVRAIGESGGIFTRPTSEYKPLAEREKTDPAFTREVLGTSDLAKLRAMSWQDILAKLEAHKGQRPFWPDVDGWFLPQSEAQIYAEGKQAHVPLLAGWNRDEPWAGVARYPTPVTPESFKAEAEQEFGPRAGEFMKLFPANTQAEAERSAIDLAGAKFITYSTWVWLQAQLKTGDAPVYHYHFMRPSPADKFHPAGSGAFHSDEIEYVFGTLDSRHGAQWQPADYALSEQMQTYWTNFAKTGNPNGEGLPHWPQYDSSDSFQTMNLDATSEAKPSTHEAQWEFLKSVWEGKGQE